MTRTAILYGIAAVLVLGVLAYWAGRCSAPEPLPDEYGPARIDTISVKEFLPSEPTFVDRLIRVTVPVAAEGSAPMDTAYMREWLEREAASRDSMVADTLPPIYPLLRIETEKDRGIKVGLQNSTGEYVVKDWPECDHPCRVQAMGTSFEATESRQIPGLSLLPSVAECGAVAAGVATVAWLAGSDPLIGAAGGGGACVVVKVAF